VDTIKFLDLELVQSDLPNRWTGRSEDGLINIHVYRTLDVKYIDGSSDPEWFTVYLSVANIGSEEAAGPNLQDVEAYFRKWIVSFKEAAKAFERTWPS
jgi:hypothetical protein